MNSEEKRLIEELKIRQGDTWRVLKIMSEFVKGFDELTSVGPGITFFGSSRFDEDNPYYRLAYRTAYLFGSKGFTIITGGGPGIMEAANRGAKDAGALSVGLNIQIPAEQRPNPYQNISLEFDYFFVRKVMLLRYSMAYIIFPGGFGTLDELFEALTLIQTGKSPKFPLILFGREYWEPLLDFLKTTMLKYGTISEEDTRLVALVETPEDAYKLVVDTLKDRLQELQKTDPYDAQLEKLRLIIGRL